MTQSNIAGLNKSRDLIYKVFNVWKHLKTTNFSLIYMIIIIHLQSTLDAEIEAEVHGNHSKETR